MVRLLITRRTIALDRTEDYLSLWRRVAESAAAAGGHTWLFRGSGREDHSLEFIEDPATTGVLEDDDVAAARAELEGSFAADLEEEWHQWTDPAAESDAS